MPYRVYEDFVAGINAGRSRVQPIFGNIPATTTATPFAASFISWQKIGYTRAFPTPLPGGVTGYVVTEVATGISGTAVGSVLVAKLVNFGNLDISGASGTWTDGSQMPTVTELGASVQVASSIMGVVTTSLNATPGTFTVTYVDQNGNAAEACAAITPTASTLAGSGGIIRLNSGDWGARDITTAARQAGTTPTGVITFYGLIPICMIPCHNTTAGVITKQNVLSGLMNAYRFGAGDTIGFFATGNASKGLMGHLTVLGDN